MQHTSPKTIIMPSNGTVPTKTGLVFDWSSLLQGVLSAGVLTCIGFLIKVNATIAVIQEQKVQEQQVHSDFKQDINEIKLDIRDLRDRAIRMENRQTSKTN